MAKKSTIKKTVAKKASKKSAKPKNVAKAKKSLKLTKKTGAKTTVNKTAKKAAAKPAVKRTAKKAAETKKTKEVKKITKKKITDKKIGKKTNMPRKKIVKEKTQDVATEVISPAEARAKAIENIKGYSKEDLDHFREIILAKRDEIIEQLQNLKEQMLDPTTGEYINENSPYSLHMAEQGTDAMEREKTFLYAQRENKFLGYLEDALKRIDAGTYGICIECIEEPQHLCDTCPLIPKARLEAVPHSQLCLPIKQRQEKR
jgi:RNA polymerase-binding transcription factor